MERNGRLIQTMTTGSISTQPTMLAPFTGLRSSAAFPATKEAKNYLSSLPSNGRRHEGVVWPPIGLKKYETLTEAQLDKEIDYLLRNKWVPCLEFELEHGFVNHGSPGYYDGR
ncbi:hypothetical protein L1987_37917 [Smallanthus sonchifolius]|uniref:Uncharacterized protein n=1 Tax=Smallanthus sonchifolius TaxID=185202 RepID=A0ACB9HJ22_9ASTR|nr:hypothetical protein L1987_37917 [Smallanthus sonchifolius]